MKKTANFMVIGDKMQTEKAHCSPLGRGGVNTRCGCRLSLPPRGLQPTHTSWTATWFGDPLTPRVPPRTQSKAAARNAHGFLATESHQRFLKTAKPKPKKRTCKQPKFDTKH